MGVRARRCSQFLLLEILILSNWVRKTTSVYHELQFILIQNLVDLATTGLGNVFVNLVDQDKGGTRLDSGDLKNMIRRK